MEYMMNFVMRTNLDFNVVSFVEQNTGSYYEQFLEQDKMVFGKSGKN